MKKILLTLAAVALASAANAQFNAADWVLNTQGFNKVDGAAVSTLSTSDDNKVLTATFPATAASTLSRFELSSNADITMGAGQNVVVMKVEFENCCFQDFDGNVISILRQLYNGTDNTAPQNAPFFVTNQNLNAGRMSNPQNTPTATTAYYWRDMATIGNSNGTCDWTKEFTIYGRKFNNSKFTVDGSDMYGRCWLGIRFAHLAKNENVIGENAAVKISYIGVTSLNELGVANSSDLKGTDVRTYIEAQLNKTTTGIEDITNDADITISVTGTTIEALGADKVEVYNLTGAKVAESLTGRADVNAGIYIVKAFSPKGAAVRKVSVR